MLYTIGHGNRSWTDFASLLKGHDCLYLIDVRSTPKSRHNPSFDREQIKGLCEEVGIRYVFLGDVLGGRPGDRTLYDPQGRVDYSRVEQSVAYRSGIERLVKAAELSQNVAIMCSELNPSECHRSKLIGRTLANCDVVVHHIDKHGKAISQAEAINDITGGHEDLFGDNTAVTKSRGRYV